MRSATEDAESLGTVAAPPDTSARGRILDAAVVRFARSGFGASVRAIATDAGVSPALVIHHFGSKDGLREVCDAHVLAWIVDVKRRNMTKATTGRLFEVLAQAEEFAPLVGYVLRSMQDGGAVGRAFVEHMIADAEQYTAEAVEQGIVLPSRDEPARVRYLVYSGLGALLLAVTMNPPKDPEDLNAAVTSFLDDLYLPMLEVFTEGFLTTTRMLDDYLRYTSPTTTHDEEGP